MANWISVSPDGWTRWEVNLTEFPSPVVVTVCVKRTGTEYKRRLKQYSINWARAVRLARDAAMETQPPARVSKPPLQDENTVSCGGCGSFTHEACTYDPAFTFIDGVCPHDPRPWVKAARAAHAGRA
jgi:hypothetical protein